MKTDIMNFVADEFSAYENIDFKLILAENHETTIVLHNGQTEQLQQATATSLALNLLIDGRDGFYYTNNLDQQELKIFIRQSIENTTILEPDRNHTLPDPSRYYKGDGPELKNFDDTLHRMNPIDKLHLAEENHNQALNRDRRIISIQTRYSDYQHQASFLTSNGFSGYEENSRCTLSTILTVEGENGQHPMDGWGETRIFFNDMPHSGVAEIALERTLRKIGQKPIQGRTCTMILESPIAGYLLQPILNAMSGQALQQNTSFLYDKLDQQVSSPVLQLVDDPLIPGTIGASHFDYDGVATQRRTIIDHGILRTYFIDTLYSKKLGMEPTTQGTHHLIMQPGRMNLNELVQEVGEVILVTDFNGGNCDSSTGNFSYGIEGYLIHGGKITQPLSGMNITGNMLKVWKNLSKLGNDADPWERDLIPSLVFEGIQFSGL